MQGRRGLVDAVWSRDVVVSSTVSRQFPHTFNLLLTCLAFRAPCSVCALAISALVLWRVFPRAIPRLMALGTVHALDGIGTGGSYVTILLTVEALSHTRRPVVQDGRQTIAVPKNALVDRHIGWHRRSELHDQ
jgi:hypothetical protein